MILHSKPGPGFQCAYAWILNKTPQKKIVNQIKVQERI